MIEAIVYLARKLHWSRKEIGKLTPSQFNELMEELQFQEAQERYRQDHGLASILAAIANTIPSKSHRTYKARDFLGYPEPKREPEKALEELAEEKGIKMPHNPTRKQV